MAAPIPHREMQMIPIHLLISEDETRLKRDEDHIEWLMTDFRERLRLRPDLCPVQTPLRVFPRGQKYVILAGNNRYEAALRVGLDALPCIVEDEPADEADELIEQVRDNELHRPYTPIERARNILRLVELKGCSQGEAAKRLGVCESQATKAVKVLKSYPADLHPLVGEGSGKVPFTCAYLLASLNDEAKVREFSERIAQGRMTRDELIAALGAISRNRGKKPKPIKLSLAGLTLVINVMELPKLKGLLAQVGEAIAKVEKHALPLQSLPSVLRTN